MVKLYSLFFFPILLLGSTAFADGLSGYCSVNLAMGWDIEQLLPATTRYNTTDNSVSDVFEYQGIRMNLQFVPPKVDGDPMGVMLVETDTRTPLTVFDFNPISSYELNFRAPSWEKFIRIVCY